MRTENMKADDLLPALVSVNDACKYLGCISRANLYGRLKGRLEWVRIGGRSMITVSSLNALVAEGIEAANNSRDTRG